MTIKTIVHHRKKARLRLNGRAFRVLSPSGIGGAMFGGVMGSALGPIGAAAGLLIGGVAGEAVERHYRQERELADRKPAV